MPKSSSKFFAYLIIAILGLLATLQGRCEATIQPQWAKDALNRFENDKDGTGGVWVQEIIAAQATQAIPTLKQRFRTDGDIGNRELYAAALIRLGVHEELYWQFLERQAEPAIDSDEPMISDDGGKELSPGYKLWVEEHHLSLEKAVTDSMWRYPEAIAFLGLSEDPRATLILHKALLSRNPFILIKAADALAEMQDGDAVPLMLEAAQRSPDIASLLAYPLAYFDDSRAIQFVDARLPQAVVAEVRAKRARGCLPNDCWLVGKDDHIPPRAQPIHNVTFH